MEGGLTRHRAYLFLTAALLLALLIVVISLRPKAEDVPFEESIITTTEENVLVTREVATQTERQVRPAKRLISQPAASPSAERTPTSIYHKDKYLYFNLNTADSTDLVQLYNIGPTFARRIIGYRTRLGGFVDKSQLWEVKGMDSVRYNDIAPHLYANPADIRQMDLNSVTLDQLKRHPYLDYYQAKAIVQLREDAGAYHHIEEILKIPIIDNETYTHIAPYLTCNSQPMK